MLSATFYYIVMLSVILCHFLFAVMLRVNMLNVVMLSVIKLNVIMLSFVAPHSWPMGLIPPPYMKCLCFGYYHLVVISDYNY